MTLSTWRKSASKNSITNNLHKFLSAASGNWDNGGFASCVASAVVPGEYNVGVTKTRGLYI